MKDTGPDIIEDVTMLAPPQPWDWMWQAGIFFAICIVVGVVLWLLFRAKKLPFQHPAIPPEVTARERLTAIRHLIAEGQHERFVIEVSAILRDYIEARFGLKAPRLSSEEFLFEAERSALLDKSWREALGRFLHQCDRVKFALAHLLPPGMEELYATAEAFIDQAVPLTTTTATSSATTTPETAPAASPAPAAPAPPADPAPSA